MKDVNELKSKLNNPYYNQQTISLSALTENEKNNNVEINTLNNNIKVTSNHHHSFNSQEQREIDPNEINKMINGNKKQKNNPSRYIEDIALSQLDATVRRKIDEYNEFKNRALLEDTTNRERIEDGLEYVNGEMQYMPNESLSDDYDSEELNYKNKYDDYDSKELNYKNKYDDYDSEELNYKNKYDDYDSEELNYKNKYDDYDSEELNYENKYDDITETKNNTMENIDDKYIDNEIVVDPSDDFNIDDEDFEDVTVDTDENLTDDQISEISEISEKRLRSEILEKIVNTGKKLDISQLTVSNKVINIKNTLPNEKKIERTATWPLTFAGRPYITSALKGPEIALMSDSDTSSENGVGLSMTQAKVMFEHDMNPYKPNTLEGWAKTIPFADVENIFAALYIASMKGANYIPMACSKLSCQYAYLSEDTDIDKMIKYENDDSRKNFENIKEIKLSKENTSSYEAVISNINNKFAIGLKLPSIFTIIYEYNSLNREFIDKYATIVAIIQYIDYIYYIDEKSKSLCPIGWKKYIGNNAKTFKSKIATYSKILKELDDTDFSILMALINSMVSKAATKKSISFEIPSAKCPKCGAEIPAKQINARGLVFMRQRLVELATIPIVK